MLLKWTKKLSGQPLCMPPEPPCIDDYMVNAAAISDDGSRVVAGTYYKQYEVLPNAAPMRQRVDGRYGIYVFDTNGLGMRLFSNEFQGDEGIYTVAISGNGAIAAGAGMLNRTSAGQPRRGIVRAFEVATGRLVLDTSMFVERVNSVAL